MHVCECVSIFYVNRDIITDDGNYITSVYSEKITDHGIASLCVCVWELHSWELTRKWYVLHLLPMDEYESHNFPLHLIWIFPHTLQIHKPTFHSYCDAFGMNCNAHCFLSIMWTTWMLILFYFFAHEKLKHSYYDWIKWIVLYVVVLKLLFWHGQRLYLIDCIRSLSLSLSLDQPLAWRRLWSSSKWITSHSCHKNIDIIEGCIIKQVRKFKRPNITLWFGAIYAKNVWIMGHA